MKDRPPPTTMIAFYVMMHSVPNISNYSSQISNCQMLSNIDVKCYPNECSPQILNISDDLYKLGMLAMALKRGLLIFWRPLVIQ